MATFLESIDARTRLAGNNKLEILLFSLGADRRTGRRETFGINVFKVCEVMRAPLLTAAPEMPAVVKGMACLRGVLVPVIDLAAVAGVDTEMPQDILIVTEYNGYTQGFLVEGVDTILRLDWSQMRVPPAMLAARTGGLVTAVTELADERLVMMMDVEKVLAETAPDDGEAALRGIAPVGRPECTVFFADDSLVARKQIERTLDAMEIGYVAALNGRAAWEALDQAADRAAANGKAVREVVSLVLTDIEMPEMDGYLLTRRIKSDPRFDGIPVIMHSSLSGDSNQSLGLSVGVDEYVPKSRPQLLAEVLRRRLAEAARPLAGEGRI